MWAELNISATLIPAEKSHPFERPGVIEEYTNAGVPIVSTQRKADVMEVTVIFDPAFRGRTGRAVWIVDTPANRRWFATQPDRDPNSALFSADLYATADEAATHMIWNAQEHHPAWDQITVIGVVLTPAITAAFQAEGAISSTPTGFLLKRPYEKIRRNHAF
ncbi:MAG: hypothetical protein ACLPSW_03980 [Roseiarcus sp.]